MWVEKRNGHTLDEYPNSVNGRYIQCHAFDCRYAECFFFDSVSIDL